ncbi:MAG TPA: JDVT-CTERM system glutamic-type intramembrane protease [Gammaproteobacteria bacterium]|nr:JDVT-CTERM system glutamic-type intramembrane protease [Gammaproteobacteria bacterium]
MDWRDLRFWLAMGAALPVWAALAAWAPGAVHPAWPLGAPLAFVLPALVYPVAEEVIFRGAVQETLHDRLPPFRLGPVTGANLLTSVVFTALHFIHHPPLWATLVFLPSLVFGYFKDRTGSLQAPIALHVFYNAGYFWLFGGP